MYDSHEQFMRAAEQLCNAMLDGDDSELAGPLSKKIHAWTAEPWSAGAVDELARILNPLAIRYPTAKHLLDYVTRGPLSSRQPIGQIEGQDVYDVQIVRAYLEDDEIRIYYRAELFPEPKEAIYDVLEIPFEELLMPAALADFQEACRNEVMLRRFGRFGSGSPNVVGVESPDDGFRAFASFVTGMLGARLVDELPELRAPAWIPERPGPDEPGIYWRAVYNPRFDGWQIDLVRVRPDETGTMHFVDDRDSVPVDSAGGIPFTVRYQRLTKPAPPEVRR